jgi:hypothetical protein
METQQNTPRALFRVLKIMYISILLGTIMFVAIAFVFLKQSKQVYVTDIMTLQYFWFASLFITLAMIPGSYYLYKKKIEGVSESMNLTQKLIFYRTPFILRLALLEICCALNTSFFLITGNNYILFAALIVLIILLINYPGKSSISNDLKLNIEESDQL